MVNAIHRINHYPADSVVCFVNIYPLDSDLSGGYRYPAYEQTGPELYSSNEVLFIGALSLAVGNTNWEFHIKYLIFNFLSLSYLNLNLSTINLSTLFLI